MKVKPIRTDAEHHLALNEIERLCGSPSGTPEGDRLDVWIALVEAAYQAQASRCIMSLVQALLR